MSDVKKIVASIQDAVDTLGASAEIRQDTLFKELIGLTKTLETRGDVLLNNIKNLGVINKIKVKLERLIIDPKYKEDVKKFIGSYSDIQDLSNQYFSQFNAKYKPSATANGVKQTAIQSTLNGLFENGINTGVIDGLKKILQTNISAGGSYAHLTEQLRNYMLTNDTGDGALQRYVKTYANTAINQFSAEYNKTIADDLGLEWYGYDGSLLTTSREFCDKCVEKKYIHVSEFPALIKGDFGALGEIHIAKSTGLPDGMMAGTDETNLVRRRGGWNCGHQMIAVAESVVPQNIRDAVYASQAYKDWTAKNGKVAKEVTPIIPAKVDPNKFTDEQLKEQIGKLINNKTYKDSVSFIENKVKKGLLPDHMKNIPIEELASINFYTGNNYFDLNHGIRTGKLNEFNASLEKVLNNTLDKLPNDIRGIYTRGAGLNMEVINGYKTAFDNKEVYPEKAFMSTSREKSVADEFANNIGRNEFETIFIVKGKSGKSISSISLHGNTEDEVLFKSGLNFNVIGFKEIINSNSQKTYRIELEEV
jgi:hypothetical protein